MGTRVTAVDAGPPIGAGNYNWSSGSTAQAAATRRDIYVNADTGSNEDGAGTAASPWATFAFALASLTPGVEAVIHLAGEGPYDLPSVLSPVTTDIEVVGDADAFDSLISGEFTGALSGFTAPCSEIGGTDEFAGAYLKILSGALAGLEVEIAEHTGTSVTFVNTFGFTEVLQAGDEFRIFWPATEMQLDFSAGNDEVVWSGFRDGGVDLWLGTDVPKLKFRNLSFVGASDDQLTFQNCVVGFSTVATEITLAFYGPTTQVQSGLWRDASVFDVAGEDRILFGAGLAFRGGYLDVDYGAQFFGVLSYLEDAAAATLGYFAGASVFLVGARIDQYMSINIGVLSVLAQQGYTRLNGEGCLLYYGGASGVLADQMVITSSSATTPALSIEGAGQVIVSTDVVAIESSTQVGARVTGSGMILFSGTESPDVDGTPDDIDVNGTTDSKAAIAASGTSVTDAVFHGVVGYQ